MVKKLFYYGVFRLCRRIRLLILLAHHKFLKKYSSLNEIKRVLLPKIKSTWASYLLMGADMLDLVTSRDIGT
jgi:hypothetical protein